MKFITDILFSTSLRASFARVVAAGLAWALSLLSGVAIFAEVELPGPEWLESTAAFFSAILLALVAHIVSLVSSKFQKDELPK